MLTLLHPASLNPLQQFKQATALFKRSSRARNGDWYQQALDLDCQLHIRSDGATVACFYHDKGQNRWFDGPRLTEAMLKDGSGIEACAASILEHARSISAESLGVILHLADEFAIAELKTTFEDPELLPELRQAAIADPVTILDDSSVSPELSAWRVLPYPAQGNETIGTAVTVTRAYAPFLEALRRLGQEENFPIITHALSAPLVALAGVPQAVRLEPGKAFVAVLHYPFFTVLGFFNAAGELLLIRTQQHRGQRRPNLQSAIQTTNASLELQDPDVFVFALGAGLEDSLIGDLRSRLFGSRVERIAAPAIAELPEWCAELGLAVSPPAAGESPSRTFEILHSEGWVFQDFLPPSQEQMELFPTRAEMALLKSVRIARVAVLALGVLAVGWSAFGVLNIIRQDEWSFNPEDATFASGRLNMLNKEKQDIAHFDNLLEDRSKAWTSMELLSELFPEGPGIRILDFNHTVRPDSAPGQAKVGYVKEWKLRGVARREGLDLLQELNTRDGISARFASIARLTGDTSYDPGLGNRSLVPNMRTQENPSFRQRPAEEISDLDDSTYPLNFDFTITQRFESTDPLALNVAKAGTAP